MEREILHVIPRGINTQVHFHHLSLAIHRTKLPLWIDLNHLYVRNRSLTKRQVHNPYGMRSYDRLSNAVFTKQRRKTTLGMMVPIEGRDLRRLSRQQPISSKSWPGCREVEATGSTCPSGIGGAEETQRSGPGRVQRWSTNTGNKQGCTSTRELKYF